MKKLIFTFTLKEKGWKIKDFLAHIGHSYDWYHNQCKGDEKKQLRLMLMIKAVERKEEKASKNESQ